MPRIFPESPEELTPAPLIRRLAAALYDGLICIAITMVTTGVYMAVSAAAVGPEQYKAMNESGATVNDPLLSSILFITLYLFFAYFWTRNGQTLGMQVWHLRIQNRNGSSISWLQALLRFMMGWISWLACGLGFFWALFNKEKLTWHDKFSESVVVRIPKRK